jgi:putative acyl-CoA dehydrogenase
MAVRASGRGTHEVSNRPPALEGLDLFETDRALVEALGREGAGWARELAGDVGRTWRSARVLRLGADANEAPAGAARV